MHPIRSLKTLRNLSGKRVLVRVDFNVPMKGQKILEDSRIRATLPTIEYLRSQGAQIILLSHLGRPKGKFVASLSLDSIALYLGKLLKTKVKKLNTGAWNLPPAKRQQIARAVNKMKNGDVVMFDNIRFALGEEKNTSEFAETLATFGDIFVLDGFGVAHRDAPSVTGIARHLPSYAGLLLEQEVKGLDFVLNKHRYPFVAIIGGAKMETKVPVIKTLLKKVDFLLVGGGIFNTYLHAAGYKIGKSLMDSDYQAEALAFLQHKKTVLPVDLVVGDKKGKNTRVVVIRNTPHQICKTGEFILDVGPATLNLYASYIKRAKTLLWNGAVGYFEQKPYDIGTLTIARLVAARCKGKAYGAVGGGETVQALDLVKMTDQVDLVSTGGGAMLEYVSGKKLPGVEVVSKNK